MAQVYGLGERNGAAVHVGDGGLRISAEVETHKPDAS